jgi:Ca2+-binding RTX toxin-like protein
MDPRQYTLTGVFESQEASLSSVTFHDATYSEDGNDLLVNDEVITAPEPILVDGVLTIRGSDLADTILLRRSSSDATKLEVLVNGEGYEFTASQVVTIRVNSRAGNDVIQFAADIRNKTIIHAGDGDDSITGGAGRDRIYAEAGNDWLHGGNGHDVLFGGEGTDLIYGGNGNDTLFGGAGNDTLQGNSNDDSLFGEDGLDELLGGAGNDAIEQG